ncbi:MAG: hypothetical protein ACR2Q4_07175 [Geminicoccaceae bacterium]
MIINVGSDVEAGQMRGHLVAICPVYLVVGRTFLAQDFVDELLFGCSCVDLFVALDKRIGTLIHL